MLVFYSKASPSLAIEVAAFPTFSGGEMWFDFKGVLKGSVAPAFEGDRSLILMGGP